MAWRTHVTVSVHFTDGDFTKFVHRCVAAPDSLKSEKKYRDLKILINRAPEYLAATTFTTVLIIHVSDTGNNSE